MRSIPTAGTGTGRHVESGFVATASQAKRNEHADGRIYASTNITPCREKHRQVNTRVYTADTLSETCFNVMKVSETFAIQSSFSLTKGFTPARRETLLVPHPSRRNMQCCDVFCAYGVHNPPLTSVPVLLLYLFSVLLEFFLDAGPGRDALHVLPRVGEGLHHLVAPLEGGAVTDGGFKDASDEPLETLRMHTWGMLT